MLNSNYIHRFIEGTNRSAKPLVLLHGSGGNEKSLLPFADDIAPTSPKLAIRGTVEIDGGYAFFNRFADRSIDENDLRIQAVMLANFINTAIFYYSFNSLPILVGYSNGSVMAAALLLSEADSYAGGVLLRPLQPFKHDLPYKLEQTAALVIEAKADERRVACDGLLTAEQLKRAGARVEHHNLAAGHAITSEDRDIARQWLHQFRA